MDTGKRKIPSDGWVSKKQKVDGKTTEVDDPSLSTGACLPAPGLTEKDVIGTGGCFAVALSALEVLGDSKVEVSAKLDAQINKQHEEFNEQRSTKGQAPYDRHRIGVEGQQWHPEVVRRALKMEYGPGGYVFKKADLSLPWHTSVTGTGTYIIDGILNRSYIHKEGCKRGVRMYQPGHDVPDLNDDWRHCIALDLYKGEFYCIGAGGWAPIADLWVDDRGHPDQHKGYMKRILKVYRVQTLLGLSMSPENYT